MADGVTIRAFAPGEFNLADCCELFLKSRDDGCITRERGVRVKKGRTIPSNTLLCLFPGDSERYYDNPSEEEQTDNIKYAVLECFPDNRISQEIKDKTRHERRPDSDYSITSRVTNRRYVAVGKLEIGRLEHVSTDLDFVTRLVLFKESNVMKALGRLNGRGRFVAKRENVSIPDLHADAMVRIKACPAGAPTIRPGDIVRQIGNVYRDGTPDESKDSVPPNDTDTQVHEFFKRKFVESQRHGDDLVMILERASFRFAVVVNQNSTEEYLKGFNFVVERVVCIAKASTGFVVGDVLRSLRNSESKIVSPHGLYLEMNDAEMRVRDMKQRWNDANHFKSQALDDGFTHLIEEADTLLEDARNAYNDANDRLKALQSRSFTVAIENPQIFLLTDDRQQTVGVISRVRRDAEQGVICEVTTRVSSASSGLRWREIGSERPDEGVELTNAASLSNELRNKTSFTRDEWNGLNIVEKVSTATFVRAGAKYFRPVGDYEPPDMQEEQSVNLVAQGHLTFKKVTFEPMLSEKSHPTFRDIYKLSLDNKNYKQVRNGLANARAYYENKYDTLFGKEGRKPNDFEPFEALHRQIKTTFRLEPSYPHMAPFVNEADPNRSNIIFREPQDWFNDLYAERQAVNVGAHHNLDVLESAPRWMKNFKDPKQNNFWDSTKTNHYQRPALVTTRDLGEGEELFAIYGRGRDTWSDENTDVVCKICGQRARLPIDAERASKWEYDWAEWRCSEHRVKRCGTCDKVVEFESKVIRPHEKGICTACQGSSSIEPPAEAPDAPPAPSKKLPTWNAFITGLRDAVRVAQQTAPFAGRSTLFGADEGLDYESASALLMSQGGSIWTQYQTARTHSKYDPNILMSTDDPATFAQLFRKCFEEFRWFRSGRQQGPIDKTLTYGRELSDAEFTASFILGEMWSDLGGGAQPYMKHYVLSKPQINMTWHVDKNKGPQTDVVIYVVVGALGAVVPASSLAFPPSSASAAISSASNASYTHSLNSF